MHSEGMMGERTVMIRELTATNNGQLNRLIITNTVEYYSTRLLLQRTRLIFSVLALKAAWGIFICKLFLISQLILHSYKSKPM